MKTIYKNSINIIKVTVTLLIGLGFFYSCVDEPETIFTSKKQSLSQYMVDSTEFSEFKKLLDTTKVLDLVNSYGEFTMFAPTNEAMYNYYHAKGKTSLNDFTVDTLKKIAYDHIIKGYELTSGEFIDGLLPYLTMSERFVSTSSKADGNRVVFYVNGTSAIRSKDIELSNGILHVIDKLIDPSNLNIAQLILNNKNKFSIFIEALQKTKLIDSIDLTRDFSYDPKKFAWMDQSYVQGGGSKDELPATRKYGYTVFMESDETYKKFGIASLDDLIQYAKDNVYYDFVDKSNVDISDFQDSRNPLNRFVRYHLLDRKLTSTALIDALDSDHMLKTMDMFEYVETMCPGALIEVKKERSSGRTNIINKTATDDGLHIIAKDSDAVNGVYHELDNILIYNSKIAQHLSTKRLRMDVASFFPELTNNNMRYYDKGHPRSWVLPVGYLNRMTVSKTTSYIAYLNACDGYLDYQGDEFFTKTSMYEVEMVTPPIPAGTYQVRYGYQPTPWRGAVQVYWDGKPCGIPLDLRILADDPLVGWIEPGIDPLDPYGYENDKMMKNRGYYKGPDSYRAPVGGGYSAKIARQSVYVLRKVIGVFKFDRSENHRIKVKAIRDGQLMMDYLEFVPVEMLENEDIH